MLFLVSIVNANVNVVQIGISQINQTNGEKFSEVVMPASYITNATVNPYITVFANITGLQDTLNAMNLSSATNDTASQGRDDTQNVSIMALQINDTYFNGSFFPLSVDFRNDTAVIANNTANLANSSNRIAGGFDVLFTNGSNVLVAGTKSHVKAKYAGVLTDLTAHSVETGSINISAYNLTLGTYIGSVVITTGTNGSTSGLSYDFAKGDWLNLTISSVTNIKQVTAAVQTTRS